MDQLVPIRKPILAISSCLTSWNETFFLHFFSATWKLLNVVMGVVARSLAIIFRFQLFLIVTISYCHSQCNFNCFLLFNYESQSFLGFFLSLTDIRHQVDNILFHPECMRCQICKEVNSFEDTVSTMLYYMWFKILKYFKGTNCLFSDF